MPTKFQILSELNRRGALTEDEKAEYRGMIQAELDRREAAESVPKETQTARAPQMAQAHQPAPDVISKFLQNALPSLVPENIQPMTAGERLAQTWQTASPIVRPVGEGVATAAGAAIGLATPAGPYGMLAGSGLGYSGAKTVFDNLDRMAGMPSERNLVDNVFDPVGSGMQRGSDLETVTRPVRDVVAGAGMAAAGDIVGRGLIRLKDLIVRGRELQAAKSLPDTAKYLISKREAEKRAGKTLENMAGDWDVFGQNIEDAIEIEKIINQGAKPGDPIYKFSLGARSYNPDEIAAQQTYTGLAKSGKLLAAKRQAENNAALRNYFQRNFGGQEGADDVLASLERYQTGLQNNLKAYQNQADVAKAGLSESVPGEAGGEMLSAVRGAKKEVQAQIQAIDDLIPEYPMQLKNLETEMLLLERDPTVLSDVKNAVRDFRENILPKATEDGKRVTTKTWVTLNKELNALAKAAYRSPDKKGSEEIGRAFTILRKNGLQNDLDAVADLARTGKIMDYKGQAVNVDNLAKKLETDVKYYTELKAKAEPDIDALRAGIRAGGEEPFMQVVRESNESFAERLSNQYRQLTNQPPPVKGANAEELKRVEERITATRQIIAEASPGQDVAALIRARNDFVRSEYAGRFKTSNIKAMTNRGDSMESGTRMSLEQIENRFTRNVDAAKELVNSIGPDKAKDAVRGKFAYELLRLEKTDAEKMSVGVYNTWLKRNEAVLKQYGLYDEFSTIAAAQQRVDSARGLAREFEKSTAGGLIGTDPKALISRIVSGNDTIEKMKEVMKKVQHDPAAVRGLKNAFGEWVDTVSETTWKEIAQDKASASAAKFANAMKKAEEAAKVLYRDEPAKLEALKTMQKVYEISNRTSRNPFVVGSPTAEKIINAVRAKGADVATGLVPYGREAHAFIRFLKNWRQSGVDEVMAHAIYDPDYAYMLVRGVRGKIPLDRLKNEVGNKLILLDEYRKQKMQQTLTGSIAAGDNR